MAWLKSPGRVAAEQVFGGLPQVSFDGQSGSKHAPQHALNIPVDYRRRHIEYDAGDGRRRVSADAGKVAQSSDRVGKFSCMLLRDGFGRRMQHAGTTVVSQAAPGRQHGRFPRRGQFLHRGKALQETAIVLRAPRRRGSAAT